MNTATGGERTVLFISHRVNNGSKRTETTTKTGERVSLTSCSVSVGGSEMWGLGPGRRGRPAAECGWCDPMTETRADAPEECPLHTWRQKERERQFKGSYMGLSNTSLSKWSQYVNCEIISVWMGDQSWPRELQKWSQGLLFVEHQSSLDVCSLLWVKSFHLLQKHTAVRDRVSTGNHQKLEDGPSGRAQEQDSTILMRARFCVHHHGCQLVPRQIKPMHSISKVYFLIVYQTTESYLPIVLTTQGLCPSRGTVSSISGWVLTKFSTSSGSVVEELNLDPCTAQPPGLQTRKKNRRVIDVQGEWEERTSQSGLHFFMRCRLY